MFLSAARVRAGLSFVAAACSALLLPVSVSGQTGPLQLSPASLTFPTQPIGSSATQTFLLVNTSGSPVAITSPSLQGTSGGQFSVTSACGNSVAATSNCALAVTYMPSQPVAATDVLQVSGGGSTITAQVAGTGVNGSTGPVSLSATALSFIFSGEPKGVTLTNNGAAPLGITSIKVDSVSFSEIDSCGNSLAAGSSCQIFVTPVATSGSLSGTLTITSSDQSDAQTVSLSGQLTYGQTGFGVTGSGYSPQQLFGHFGGVSTPPTAGSNGYSFYANDVTTSFPFYGQNCDTKAAQGAAMTCPSYVFIGPGGPQGRVEATASFNDGGTASLAGLEIGSAKQFYLGNPSVVVIPTVVGRSNTVTIQTQNTSTLAITISSATLSTGSLNNGDFKLTNGCGGLSNYGSASPSSCPLTVVFTPTTTGLRQTLLTVTEASGYTSTVLISGNAGPVAPVVPGTTVPSAQVNATSTQTVSVNVASGNEVTAALATGTVFQVSPSSCTPVNNVCQFTITFTPPAASNYRDTLTVTDLYTNATGSGLITGSGGLPIVTFSPSTLSFPAQPANTGTSLPLTLKNTGNGPLTINYPEILAGNPYFTESNNNCGSSLAPGGSCVYTIFFKPGNAGQYTGTFDISSSANDGHSAASLLGTATGTPVLAVSPTSLTFPTQAVGTTSAAQGLTVYNSGTATGTFKLIAISGNQASDYTLTSTCGATLAPQTYCSLRVMYHPSIAGPTTEYLNLTLQETSVVTTIQITGNTSTTPTFSPTSLTFLSQAVGTTSSVLSGTLTNPSPSAVTISSSQFTGPGAASFSFLTGCGTSLAANSTCSYAVSFTPASAGALAASLVVTTSAGTATLPVSGTGAGTGAVLTFSPTSLAFPSTNIGYSSTLSATLTNTGGATATISSVSLAGGTNANAFAFTTTCGGTLAAAASCSYSATFTPKLMGAANTTISVASNTTGSPTTLALTGNGTGGQLVFSNANLQFPNVQVGSTYSSTVTLMNQGTGSATIFNTTLNPAPNSTEYSFASTCPKTVPVGATCSYTVTFAPTVVGDASTVLSVANDEFGGSPQTVQIAGSGIPAAAPGPVLTFSPGSVVFPSQTVGTTATMTATVTNTSGAAVTLGFDSLATGGMGGGSVPFRYTGSCASPLAAGASCTFTFTFAPTAAGSASNTFLIGTASQGMFQLPLSGSGTVPVQNGPVLTFSPASLVFPAQMVGTGSLMSATLTNTSGSAVTLTFDSLATGGTGGGSEPFRYTGSCPSPLAAGASCTFNVTFTPNAAGAVSNTLLIGTASQGTFQLPLSGTGTVPVQNGPVLTFSPAPLAFPATTAGTSATLTATLTNTSSSAVTLTFDSLATGGMGGGSIPFSYTGSCPSPLAAGASCTFNVTFAPNSAGAANNMLQIGSSAGTFSLQISGTGVEASPSGPALTFSPASLAFPATQVGSSVGMTSTVTNTSGSAVTLTYDSLATGGMGGGSVPFSYTGSCPSPLAAGASCTFQVTFSPNATGMGSNMLVIGTTAQSDAFSLPISGSGTP